MAVSSVVNYHLASVICKLCIIYITQNRADQPIKKNAEWSRKSQLWRVSMLTQKFSFYPLEKPIYQVQKYMFWTNTHSFLYVSRISMASGCDFCRRAGWWFTTGPRAFDIPKARSSVLVEQFIDNIRHMCARSVVSDCLRPHGLQPARLLCPRNSNTGVGCHFLFT